MKRESAFGRGRWLLAGLGTLLLPKCLLCLFAYGTVLAGPELRGATKAVSPMYLTFGLATGVAGILGLARGTRRREYDRSMTGLASRRLAQARRVKASIFAVVYAQDVRSGAVHSLEQ